MMSLDSTFISDHPPPPPREWEPDQMRSRAPVMVLEEMIFGSLPLMTQRRQSRAVRVLEEDREEQPVDHLEPPSGQGHEEEVEVAEEVVAQVAQVELLEELEVKLGEEQQVH